MKNSHLLFLLAFGAGIIFNNASCISVKTDNGKHKGWYKNPNNPHNPLTTNPGHTKSHSNGNASPAKNKSKK